MDKNLAAFASRVFSNTSKLKNHLESEKIRLGSQFHLKNFENQKKTKASPGKATDGDCSSSNRFNINTKRTQQSNTEKTSLEKKISIVLDENQYGPNLVDFERSQESKNKKNFGTPSQTFQKNETMGKFLKHDVVSHQVNNASGKKVSLRKSISMVTIAHDKNGKPKHHKKSGDTIHSHFKPSDDNQTDNMANNHETHKTHREVWYNNNTVVVDKRPLRRQNNDDKAAPKIDIEINENEELNEGIKNALTNYLISDNLKSDKRYLRKIVFENKIFKKCYEDSKLKADELGESIIGYKDFTNDQFKNLINQDFKEFEIQYDLHDPAYKMYFVLSGEILLMGPKSSKEISEGKQSFQELLNKIDKGEAKDHQKIQRIEQRHILLESTINQIIVDLILHKYDDLDDPQKQIIVNINLQPDCDQDSIAQCLITERPELYFEDGVFLYKRVGIKKDQETFGETSLFKNGHRQYIAIAYKNSIMYSLHKRNFDRCLESTLVSNVRKKRFFEEFYSGQPRGAIEEINFKFDKKKFVYGKILFNEGDPIKNVYIINSGELVLQKQFDKNTKIADTIKRKKIQENEKILDIKNNKENEMQQKLFQVAKGFARFSTNNSLSLENLTKAVFQKHKRHYSKGSVKSTDLIRNEKDELFIEVTEFFRKIDIKIFLLIKLIIFFRIFINKNITFLLKYQFFDTNTMLYLKNRQYSIKRKSLNLREKILWHIGSLK